MSGLEWNKNYEKDYWCGGSITVQAIIIEQNIQYDDIIEKIEELYEMVTRVDILAINPY